MNKPAEVVLHDAKLLLVAELSRAEQMQERLAECIEGLGRGGFFKSGTDLEPYLIDVQVAVGELCAELDCALDEVAVAQRTLAKKQEGGVK